MIFKKETNGFSINTHQTSRTRKRKHPTLGSLVFFPEVILFSVFSFFCSFLVTFFLRKRKSHPSFVISFFVSSFPFCSFLVNFLDFRKSFKRRRMVFSKIHIKQTEKEKKIPHFFFSFFLFFQFFSFFFSVS